MWLLVFGVLVCAVLVYFYLSIPNPRPPAPAERFHKHPTSNKTVPAGSIEDEPEVDLTLVIPAYNETSRIGSMLTETVTFLDSLPQTYEILIVDDGSKDGTVRPLHLPF